MKRIALVLAVAMLAIGAGTAAAGTTTHQRSNAAAEKESAIPGDQDRRCRRRDQISEAEADEFRDREQQ